MFAVRRIKVMRDGVYLNQVRLDNKADAPVHIQRCVAVHQPHSLRHNTFQTKLRVASLATRVSMLGYEVARRKDVKLTNSKLIKSHPTILQGLGRPGRPCKMEAGGPRTLDWGIFIESHNIIAYILSLHAPSFFSCPFSGSR